MRRFVTAVLLLVSCISFIGFSPAQAQTQTPFSLPFNVPPGPSTWLSGQQYGNTIGAYNNGKYWYGAGQGLHFGLDLSAPCGTPVVAVADGVVDQVDNFTFGILPHNLTLVHLDTPYTSVYGHLLERPNLRKGQTVKRGEVIARTGDPDNTCVSRPHLHLEIRSRDYRITYNPANLIDADWSMLTTMGSFGSGIFAKDLYNPHRWQIIGDQPDIHLSGATLNRYRAAWPPASRYQPPARTMPELTAPAIPEGGKSTIRQLTKPGCCSMAWWTPDSRSVEYFDGPAGQLASVMNIGIQDGTPQAVDPSPRLYAPDGKYKVHQTNNRTIVTRLSDNANWQVDTKGAWPRFSPDGSKLLWQAFPTDPVPGVTPPNTEIWIANVGDNGVSGATRVASQPGGSVYWLDDDRLMFSRREGLTDVSSLTIYTLSTAQSQVLLTGKNIRGTSVAPGGKRLLYYQTFQSDPAANGVYLLDTQPGATPVKQSFFGSWRWRDSSSILYIPYKLGEPMALVWRDILTGQEKLIADEAQGFRVANDDWAVSPDGQYVLFWAVKDFALWLIELPKG
ncbi:MAG: M23 family metallopeptidase [Anaerolineae bacterium]|nr:M23 family metallopeptidase [Anaerolineae bacterium]